MRKQNYSDCTVQSVVQPHKNRSVLPLLIKIIRSPLVHLMITLVFPLQIAISIGGVLLFSANSEMLRDIFSFLKVVLWQGYLSGRFLNDLLAFRMTTLTIKVRDSLSHRVNWSSFII